MIVIDRSAIVAVLLRQAGWERLDAVIRGNVSVIPGLVREEAIVLLSSGGLADAPARFDAYVAESGMTHQKFSKRLTARTQTAFLRYGQVVRPDGLDLSEAMALATAKAHKAPLLYADDRFDFTKVERA